MTIPCCRRPPATTRMPAGVSEPATTTIASRPNARRTGTDAGALLAAARRPRRSTSRWSQSCSRWSQSCSRWSRSARAGARAARAGVGARTRTGTRIRTSACGGGIRFRTRAHGLLGPAALALGRGPRARVGPVEPGALEDDPHGGEQFSQPAVALRALRERGVREGLHHLELVAAGGAGVLVRGHVGLRDLAGASGTPTLRVPMVTYCARVRPLPAPERVTQLTRADRDQAGRRKNGGDGTIMRFRW